MFIFKQNGFLSIYYIIRKNFINFRGDLNIVLGYCSFELESKRSKGNVK
uniref:Uncharacterized protein n=1 Tax=Arundo donax TaxID=35708 RepID=A0A0A8ZHT2_ARUDO